ncbi:sensor histidine kinase [Sphingomonas quercus]|nr:PAS domain-containing sensor histidine kinase [Sphingomonas quercus]
MKADRANVTAHSPRWWRRFVLARQRGLVTAIEGGTLLAAICIFTASYFIVTGGQYPSRLLTPPIVALLLVANLVPAMALMVLFARRVARQRSARRPGAGNGRLHVRLVAIFSAIAAVPTLLVVIFASLLFQYGVEFWFSDSARKVLENSDRVARAYVTENEERLQREMIPMAEDFRYALNRAPINDPRISGFVAVQGRTRNLSEIALIEVGTDGVRRAPLVALADTRALENRLPAEALGPLDAGQIWVSANSGDRAEAVIALNPRTHTYLYASRFVDGNVLAQVRRTQAALGDYNSLLVRSRTLQLQFNAALLVVSLLIVGAAIVIALMVADRLVRPVGELVDAARRVTAGDLSVRVDRPRVQDEVGILGFAFNRMTRRLEEQTSALVTANAQLDSRRAFIEAVLSGVTAGVISVNGEGRIRLINSSAAALLKTDVPIGAALSEVAPELDQLFAGPDREAVVQFSSAGEPRTLAVKLVRSDDGNVITFDDITDQLADQRRAAWADVARRIAHEIKNPLTPIQLAAERLQRRYGKEVQSDPATFERLTETIVRQVGDLRRMVDEFSSFARMPKPEFAPEPIVDIARHSLFLHEVAHPNIRFVLDAPEPAPLLVCDRRQIGQAIINLVKNAVEAIDAKPPAASGEAPAGLITLALAEEQDRLTITISDNGVGLPPERERLTEPYMTTRARGTGLGLAIVKKIVEEHYGIMSFSDRPGGGAIVRITLDPGKLAPLAGSAAGVTDGEGRLPELTRIKAG